MPKSSPAAPLAESYEGLVSELKAAAAGPIGDSRFAHQWIQLTAAVDALRSLLEDSYVDWRALSGEVRSTLRRAAQDPSALIDLAHKVSLLKPLQFARQVREVVVSDLTVRYILRSAPFGRPSFLVGTGMVRELPILDDSITDPTLCGEVVEGFLALVSAMRERHSIDYLVFIDKNFGPVGALSLISSIVDGASLPAIIHRERKWSQSADFTGYVPRPGQSGLIVYDLVNTGTAIRGTSLRVLERFGSRVVGAVVLYDLKGGRKSVRVRDDYDVEVASLDGKKAVAGHETGGPESRAPTKSRLGAASRRVSARRGSEEGPSERDGDSLYNRLMAEAQSERVRDLTLHMEKRAELGKEVLSQLERELEKSPERFIAVNLDTREYLLGDDELSLIHAFKSKFPAAPAYIAERAEG